MRQYFQHYVQQYVPLYAHYIPIMYLLHKCIQRIPPVERSVQHLSSATPVCAPGVNQVTQELGGFPCDFHGISLDFFDQQLLGYCWDIAGIRWEFRPRQFWQFYGELEITGDRIGEEWGYPGSSMAMKHWCHSLEPLGLTAAGKWSFRQAVV